MHFARQGRALVVALAIGALAGWAPVGAASAQTCGYNYTGCTQPSVPAYSVGTSPTTTATAAPAAADASQPASAAAPDAASASPAAAEPQSGGLPFTGTDALSTAAAGLAAIGAGAVLVRRSRRRGPARH